MDKPRQRLTLITPPTGDVVSVEDIKKHLRVDFSDDDSLIAAIRNAVVETLDGNAWLGRCLRSQTWDLRLEDFSDEIQLPLPPLLQVEHVQYYDADNALQTLDETSYEVIGVGGEGLARIRRASGESWPTVYDRAEPVIVRFTAGYVDTDSSPNGNVPAPIIAAIKLFCGTLYEHRETIVIGQTPMQVPNVVEWLLGKYRVYL